LATSSRVSIPKSRQSEQHSLFPENEREEQI
jgi:hypothetical protein